jgi:hypothetical protein
MTAEDVVGRQVAAYNDHDLEAFLACYAADVLITSGTGQILLEGIDAVRQRYGTWFHDMPDLRAEIVGRLSRGSWVVDDERASAPSAGLEVQALVAYHVRGNVIDRVALMTPVAANAPTP